MRAPDSAVPHLQALMPPVSRAPRVPPAPLHQLRPLARVVAMVAGRLTSTGPPAIFTTLGRHPRLSCAWLLYSARLMPFGTLPRRDTELVILRVSWPCGAAYEWWQHVPLALRASLRPERDRGRGGRVTFRRSLRSPAGRGRRHRRAARAARAVGRDVAGRKPDAEQTRGDRVVPAHRALPGPCNGDRRARDQRRTPVADMGPEGMPS